MAGIRRRHGGRPERVDPLSTDQLSRLIATLDLKTLSGQRDRALLLFGFAGAFRRSELAGLHRRQLRRAAQGYVVHLDRTKDDQEGHGRDVGIPGLPDSALCPVTSVDAWLTAADITEGPIFRRVTRYQPVGAAVVGDRVGPLAQHVREPPVSRPRSRCPRSRQR